MHTTRLYEGTKRMNSTESLVQRYIACWNETDAMRRALKAFPTPSAWRSNSSKG